MYEFMIQEQITTSWNFWVFWGLAFLPFPIGGLFAAEPKNQEAALQYVRRVSAHRKPSKANEEAFNKAINEVAEATKGMLEGLKQLTTQNLN